MFVGLASSGIDNATEGALLEPGTIRMVNESTTLPNHLSVHIVQRRAPSDCDDLVLKLKRRQMGASGQCRRFQVKHQYSMTIDFTGQEVPSEKVSTSSPFGTGR